MAARSSARRATSKKEAEEASARCLSEPEPSAAIVSTCAIFAASAVLVSSVRAGSQTKTRGSGIASSEMLLDADPLPHLKCCQRRAAGEVRYEADRHDDTR